MVHDGYEILALDLLGAGASDRPDGDFFTIDEAASSLHQVMTSLRAGGGPAGRAYRRIVLVGHSLGSIAAVYSEGMYGDADGLVVTGLALTPHPPPVDPATFAALVATPYVAFPPSLRAQIFYYAPGADPGVIGYDDADLVNQVPRAEFVTGLEISADAEAIGAALIQEPVLVVLGEHDATAPASLAPTEAAYYAGAASVTVETALDVGHAVNLHLARDDAWDRVERWLRTEPRER
jgi:pimeloyl-ACP methyl ester carboxylesterase